MFGKISGDQHCKLGGVLKLLVGLFSSSLTVVAVTSGTDGCWLLLQLLKVPTCRSYVPKLTGSLVKKGRQWVKATNMEAGTILRFAFSVAVGEMTSTFALK